MKKPVIIAILFLITILPVCPDITGDSNGDDRISTGELSSAILADLETGESVSPEVMDAAFMYRYWNGTPLMITDTANRTTILDKPVRRLIAYDGSTLETLRSLNASNLIIGVPQNAHDEQTFFPEFQNTPDVGTVWSPNIESLLALHPDTIFIYATISQDAVKTIEDQVHNLDPSIRVLRFDLFRPEVYPAEARIIGKILGKNQEAEEFLSFYEPVMNSIRNRVASIPEMERKTVYFESWNAYKSAAPGSGYHEKVVFSGGRNIFADSSTPYPAVDPEAVLRLAPDIIIKQVGAGEANVGGYNDPDNSALIPVHDVLVNRTGWRTLPAVQQNKVYIIQSDILGSASHFIGMQYLAKWFYPDLFADCDPLKTHQEYLNRFQHLAFDPAIRGGFVYGNATC
ncbi:MAG: ABC transporter substrate-binding protein [Methanospirillum sp.]|uniref:ABC transporter substrate-binding protein n=1 Tax=Methanospirillum sp. TaxID=45200 RepID=UPI00236CAA10|nr:ABC transporter substrate-binding protein [Methanospirillum sp.]MDD1728814.1 ABC transporter substrate-binding protein [Methanospirillum sp.]